MKAMKLTLLFGLTFMTVAGNAKAQVIDNDCQSGNLTLTLGNADHDCRVTWVDNHVEVRVQMEMSNVTSLEVFRKELSLDELETITVHFGAGDDYFAIDDSIPVRCVVYAGDGDDLILGGMMGDQLEGQGGKDLINGAGGNDIIFTGDDGLREVMIGGTGKDVFFVPTSCHNVFPAGNDKSGDASDGKSIETCPEKHLASIKQPIEKDLHGLLPGEDVRARDAEDLLFDEEPWTDRYLPDLGASSGRPRSICNQEEEDLAIDEEDEDMKIAIPQNS